VSRQFDKSRILKVFILPPSIAELEKRLRRRGTDSEETICRRVADAKEQILHYDEYDYVIINDKIDKAIELVASVITAKMLQNTPLEDFVKSM
jgi:guanylate kinase